MPGSDVNAIVIDLPSGCLLALLVDGEDAGALVFVRDDDYAVIGKADRSFLEVLRAADIVPARRHSLTQLLNEAWREGLT